MKLKVNFGTGGRIMVVLDPDDTMEEKLCEVLSEARRLNFAGARREGIGVALEFLRETKPVMRDSEDAGAERGE